MTAWSGARRAAIALAAVFVWVVSPSPADAFGPAPALPVAAPTAVESVQFFWPFSRSPEPRGRRTRPRSFWQAPGPTPAEPQVRAEPREPAGPTASVFGDTPAVDGATRVVVFGDSMAVGLADALVTALPEEDGYQVQRMTKSSSGIVRTDYYDWAAEVRSRIEGERIDVAVWMIGINDRQPIAADGQSHQPKTPQWTEIYQSRVDELIKLLQDHGAAVYWVGLPIMRSQRYSQDIAYINNTVRARVGLQGAEYIDVWDAFADQSGAYTSHGPDLSGERRRMRRDNGIHLTNAGNAKLAHFVEQAIQRDISVAGLGADGRRIIRQTRGGGLVVAPGAGGSGAGDEVLAGDESASDAIGGPSVALSTVGSGPKSDGEEVVSPLFTVLMRGEALEPKPGRADDFSWPRGE